MTLPRLLRRILLVTGGALALLAGIVWLGGGIVLRAGGHSVIPAGDRGIEAVRFLASDGVVLRGWWWPGPDPGRAAVLLHGLRADRMQMLPRAKWLHESGYSVFLFDFRGCGESGGAGTFGYLERLDVEAALGFLRQERKVDRTVLIGVSMGASAAIMAVDSWQEGTKGAVLESPFDRLGEAVRSRVRNSAGWLEPAISPLLLAQVRPRLGFSPEALAPVEAIHRARCPILLGFGGRDPYLSAELLRGYFLAAPYPTTLWVLPKAGHTDLYRFNPEAYRRKVGDFVEKMLNSPDSEQPG